MHVDILCPGPSLASWSPAYFARRRRRFGQAYRSIAVNRAAAFLACDYWAFLDREGFELYHQAAAEACGRHRPRRPLPIPFTHADVAASLLALHGDRFARWGLLTTEAAETTASPPGGWDNFTKGGALLLARILIGSAGGLVTLHGDDMSAAAGGADFTGEPGENRGDDRWRHECEHVAPLLEWLAAGNIECVRR